MTTVALVSCSGQKNTPTVEQIQNKQMEVIGKISTIENGKDGYMATVDTKDGKSYTVTISIINLQKSGGTFKRFEVGETISAKGTFWQDDTGKNYITAKDVKAVTQ